MKKYIAEFIGTIVLASAVFSSVTVHSNITGTVSAGLALALLVFTIGRVSGAHVNPAVTLSLLALKKIKTADAFFYILAQFAGASVVLIVLHALRFPPALGNSYSGTDLFAETVGAFIFLFGVVSVVLHKNKEITDLTKSFVIGGSLTLGATIASGLHSYGVLNPALAFALGSFNLAYIIGPIVGGVLGVLVYSHLACDCDGVCDENCECPVKHFGFLKFRLKK